ncbi:MAG: hypothetical protein LLG20_18290 [Acidobacteriales bacterium]|nr:hypothetical protein [Terriglobales bacterium]
MNTEDFTSKQREHIDKMIADTYRDIEKTADDFVLVALNMDAIIPPPDDAETKRACEFYGGTQWPADVKEYRGGRPTLTRNFIPGIVARAVQEIEKETRHRPEDRDIDLLIVQAVRMLTDLQHAYNYFLSAKVELEQTCIRPVVIAPGDPANRTRGEYGRT